MKIIELSNRMLARVSDEDYSRLSLYSWTAQARASGDYHAARYEGGRYIYMHQSVLGSSDSVIQVDHIDGDGLNNERYNLRYATKRQNQRNRTRTWGRSKYKGVSWSKQKGKWRSRINTPKCRHLGFFDEEVRAAEAYNKAAIKYFGEYAALNKITGGTSEV